MIRPYFHRQLIAVIVLVTFVLTSVGPICPIACSSEGGGRLPVSGGMIHLSPAFIPAQLRGITVDPKNPLRFEFLVERGNSHLAGQQQEDEYQKLVKYFLAALTTPEDNLWVNLSPYEKNHIIEENFGLTEMGRDMLAQDYILKQITASLIYPEEGIGKEFWDKIYKRAYEQFGTTTIPINTFNKVWIIPQEASIYEQGNSAYIVKSHLKVMLEEDYLAKERNQLPSELGLSAKATEGTNVTPTELTSSIIREIILPALEKEVNEGKNFAQLRQIFSGMILAQWYKRTLKDSLLGKAYVNQQKVNGVNHDDPSANQVIYQQYLQAFKKGAYNYIKEDYDQYTKQTIPRKYFSGGVDAGMTAWKDAIRFVDRAQASNALGALVDAGMDNAMVDLSPQQGSDAAMNVSMINSVQKAAFMSKVRELPFFSVTSTDDNMGPFAFYQAMIPVNDKYGLYGLSKLASIFSEMGLINKVETGDVLQVDKIKTMMIEIKWYLRMGKQDGLEADVLNKLRGLGQSQRVDLRKWLDMNIGESVDEILITKVVNKVEEFRNKFRYIFDNDQISLQRAKEFMGVLFKISGVSSDKQESLLKALTNLYEASEKVQQQAQNKLTQELIKNHRYLLGVEENQHVLVYDATKIKSGNPYETVIKYQEAIEELFPFVVGVVLGMSDVLVPPERSVTSVNGFELENRTSGYFLGVDKQLQEASNSYVHKVVSLGKQEDPEKYFKLNPVKAISLFTAAAKLDASVDFRLISVLRKLKIKVTPAIKKEFLLLLEHKGKISHLLLQMHEAGLLEEFFPGLKKADERFSGGGHVFALSYHLLNLIGSLENYNLYLSWDKERPQDVDGLLLPLRIAALVHDLSKEDAVTVYGYPHPLSGADVFVPEILNQLMVGVSSKKREKLIKLVQWLVWHHQDLSARARWSDSKANKVDITRQSFYQDLLYFVGIGLDKEKLLALYFLTLADSRSVNPDRFNMDNSSKNYITALVRELYGFVSLNDAAAKRTVIREWQIKAKGEKEILINDLTAGLLTLGRNNFSLPVQPGLSIDQDKLIDYIKQEQVMKHLVRQFLMGAPDFLKKNTNPRVISKYIALMAVAPFLAKGKGFAVTGDLTTSFSDMFEVVVSYNGNRKGLVADITAAVAFFGISIVDGQFRTIQPDPNNPNQVTFDYVSGYVKESPNWLAIINYLYQNHYDVYKFLEDKLKNNLGEEIYYLEQEEKSGLPIKRIRFDNLGNTIEEFARNIGGEEIDAQQYKESLTLFRNTSLKVVQKTMLEEFLPWFIRQILDGNINWKLLGRWPLIKEYRANQGVINTKVYFRDVRGQTKMTVRTADRPLLLASVSRILSDRFGVDIAFAPVITTHAGTRDNLFLTYQGNVLSAPMKDDISALIKMFFSFPVLSHESLVLVAEGRTISEVEEFLKNLNASQVSVSNINRDASAAMSSIKPFVSAAKIFLGQMKEALPGRKNELVDTLGNLVAALEESLKSYKDVQTLSREMEEELFNFRAGLLPFLEDEQIKGSIKALLDRVDVLSKTHSAHAVVLEEPKSVQLTKGDLVHLQKLRGQLEEFKKSFLVDGQDPMVQINGLNDNIKALGDLPRGSLVEFFSYLITTGAEYKKWELPNPLATLTLYINLMGKLDRAHEYVHELMERIDNVLRVLDQLNDGGQRYKLVKTPTSGSIILDPQVTVVEDKAMLTPGGIDLNPANMAMSVDGQSNLPAAFDLSGIDLNSIEGFSPVMVSITPVTSLPFLN